MKEQEFIQVWLEEAKGNDNFDQPVLDMVMANLEDSLDEDELLKALINFTKPKGEQDETD